MTVPYQGIPHPMELLSPEDYTKIKALQSILILDQIVFQFFEVHYDLKNYTQIIRKVI